MDSPTNNIQDFSGLTVNGIPCPLCFIQGGTFSLGEDKHARPITVPSFYMGQYPVTQALYEAVMKTNPSYYKGANRPVESVSWYHANDFLQKLKSFTKKDFRLPSEAEWEYAARGGNKEHSQGYAYCGSDDLKQVGWYDDNSGDETKPVGLLLPNELGLYDMSGNVWEWCADHWHSSNEFDDRKRPLNGSAWTDADQGSSRVIRGGSYFNLPTLCRPSYRNDYPPDYGFDNLGFRLVLSLQSGSHIP